MGRLCRREKGWEDHREAGIYESYVSSMGNLERMTSKTHVLVPELTPQLRVGHGKPALAPHCVPRTRGALRHTTHKLQPRAGRQRILVEWPPLSVVRQADSCCYRGSPNRGWDWDEVPSSMMGEAGCCQVWSLKDAEVELKRLCQNVLYGTLGAGQR
jgi:hypothetical protein